MQNTDTFLGDLYSSHVAFFGSPVVVRNFTFESLEQFCNDKACFDGMHGMEVEYGACYGGTVCRGKLHWVGTVRIAGEG